MQSNEKWLEELAALAAILEKAPLEVKVKWGANVFTYQGKNVVSYGGFKNYFTLWFYNGVFLSDPYKVLQTSEGGSTKSLRQWRFKAFQEIDESKILEYVFEAIEVEKKGLRIPAAKFEPVPVPQILKEAFDKNPQLKSCFDALSPGKQKEYSVYLNEAKQEGTRLNRLEKCIPVILSGKGLNDKYK